MYWRPDYGPIDTEFAFEAVLLGILEFKILLLGIIALEMLESGMHASRMLVPEMLVVLVLSNA